MVLDDDDLAPPVRQRLVMRDALESGALPYSGCGEDDEREARRCALASRTEYRHENRKVGEFLALPRHGNP